MYNDDALLKLHPLHNAFQDLNIIQIFDHNIEVLMI